MKKTQRSGVYSLQNVRFKRYPEGQGQVVQVCIDLGECTVDIGKAERRFIQLLEVLRQVSEGHIAPKRKRLPNAILFLRNLTAKQRFDVRAMLSDEKLPMEYVLPDDKNYMFLLTYFSQGETAESYQQKVIELLSGQEYRRVRAYLYRKQVEKEVYMYIYVG